MKWPALVKPWACNTAVVVHLAGAILEDGSEAEGPTIRAKCSFDGKHRHVIDDQRQLVELEGALLFPGDLSPDGATLKGTVDLMGESRKIFRGSRARNPDGTVNYTKLEVL